MRIIFSFKLKKFIRSFLNQQLRVVLINLKNEKLLIIAPHADDEILGCYGLIKKIKNLGGKVYVQILTMGGYKKIGSSFITKEKWRQEFLKVCNRLKIDGQDIMFYEDNFYYLDEIPRRNLIDYFETKSSISLFKIKPTIVALPTIFSSHQDHTQAYKAVISALRIQPQKKFNSPKLIISYESPEYYFWSPYIEFGKFSPNFFLKLTETDIKNKINVMRIYQSQVTKGKRDGKKIKALATMRGSEAGVAFAEAFNVHRMIF